MEPSSTVARAPGSGPIGRIARPRELSGPRFSEVLGQPRATLPRPAAGDLGAGALRALSGLDAGQRRLDQIIAEGRSGRVFRPGELLLLQAEVHRLGEQAALVQRVAEEGAGAVKRLWSLQL
jgi:hypothetical protein